MYIANRRSGRSRKTFMAALAGLLAAGFTQQSPEFVKARENGVRHGKHNGQHPGAFGGLKRAKAHRRLYVA